MCALDESVVDRRSLLRAGDEPALQHPEQRRFLADLQRRQCLAGRLQPVRSLSRGLNGGVVDKFEKRFVLCRRFVRRFLRRADRDALGNEWRAPERFGLGISVSRDFRATRKSDAVFRRHHDGDRRAEIQLRADAMTRLSSTQRFKGLLEIEWVILGVKVVKGPVDIGFWRLGPTRRSGIMRDGEIGQGTASAVGWIFVRGLSGARDRSWRIW